jgi:hypothetical protein
MKSTFSRHIDPEIAACSRIANPQLLLQLISKGVQLGSVTLSKIFRGPDLLAKQFLQDHDSATCLTNFFAFLSGLKDFRDFIALEFQPSVVGHQLFEGSGDHLKDYGGEIEWDENKGRDSVSYPWHAIFRIETRTQNSNQNTEQCGRTRRADAQPLAENWRRALERRGHSRCLLRKQNGSDFTITMCAHLLAGRLLFLSRAI